MVKVFVFQQEEVFKIFKLLLNLFQIDGPINEVLFWPKLLLFKGISKVICDLVLYVFLEGTMRCSTSSFVGSHFIFFKFFSPYILPELSFKQKHTFILRSL